MIREVSEGQIYSALFLIYYLYFMCVLGGVFFLLSDQAVWLGGSQFPTQGSSMCSLHQGHGVLGTGPLGKFLTCDFCLQEIIKFFTDNFFKGNFGFPKSSVGKESACNAGDTGNASLISGLGRSQPVFLPGKSHGQRILVGYSSLVTKGRTQLSN